jgi:hypothetical protein
MRQLREFDNSAGGEYYSCSCSMHWSENMLMRNDTEPPLSCTHGMHNIRNTEVTFCSTLLAGFQYRKLPDMGISRLDFSLLCLW